MTTKEKKKKQDAGTGEGGSNKRGRPTLYKPEHCQTIIECGRNGFSVAQMARELEVSKECVYEWSRVHEDFSDAFNVARDLSEAWWEDKAHSGIDMQGFNHGLWGRVMSARFPSTYRETTRNELTGPNGAPLEPTTFVIKRVGGMPPKGSDGGG